MCYTLRDQARPAQAPQVYLVDAGSASPVNQNRQTQIQTAPGWFRLPLQKGISAESAPMHPKTEHQLGNVTPASGMPDRPAVADRQAHWM